MSKFAERLKELRAKKNISQDELAIILDIPRSTIAGYETGTRALPRKKRLIELANFFEVSVDYLIGTLDNIPTEDMKQQINNLLEDTLVHYDNKYIYSVEEREKIIKILVNLSTLSMEERSLALEMLARIAKKGE
jgi:transcriptional regulator with XRE-family HTH domain